MPRPWLRRLAAPTVAALLLWALFGRLVPRPVPVGQGEVVLPAGTRVVILAPHSDDETLAAGGLIQQVEAAGGQVHVVLVTSGDGFRLAARSEYRTLRLDPLRMLNLGQLRLSEAYRALDALGLARDRVIFLGYPDRYVHRLWLECWDEADPCLADTTGTTRVPYPQALRPGAPYAGQALLADLSQVLTQLRPDVVVYPHPNDSHVDHWALHNFTAAALAELQRRDPGWQPPLELLYLVHRGDWPQPRGFRPGDPLPPPATLAHGMTRWLRHPLGAEEVQRKAAALREYRSQVRLMPRYLMSFVRAEELFATLPPASLAAPEAVPAAAPAPPAGPDAARPDAAGGDQLGAGVQWVRVATDPTGDTVARNLGPAADLRELWLGQDADSLYLAVRLDGRTGRIPTYIFRVRSLSGSGWGSLISVELRNGRAVFRGPAPGDAPRPIMLRGNWLAAAIPRALLVPGGGQPDAIMVNAETQLQGVLVDRSAWRLVSLRAPETQVAGPAELDAELEVAAEPMGGGEGADAFAGGSGAVDAAVGILGRAGDPGAGGDGAAPAR